ncbi:hypothetical protein N656DRAFT_849473 [Canariomyces notabilis]|uniref:Myb-like domain-containing protein n=1 Tax=Canariomyces notabilis TaxID=2074819 RepID=A0AAN6QBW0_9PEZI|nr:hypothetical protein N656DRAFT_849473 [Canariomyces arenarius]
MILRNNVIEIPSDDESDDAGADDGHSFRLKAVCAGDSCWQGLRCPRHPNPSTKIYRREQQAKELTAKGDSPVCPPHTLPGVDSETAVTEQKRCSRPPITACSTSIVDDNESLPNGGSRESSICRGPICHGLGGESDPATTKAIEYRPNRQAQDERHDIRQDYNTHFETGNLPPHSPVLDNGEEQNEEELAVPPPLQESRASAPALTDDKTNSEFELASTEPSIQPSTSRDLVQPQCDVGHSPHRDANNVGECPPSIGTAADHSKNDVEPPQRKRRKLITTALTTVGTASQQQTPLYWGDTQEPQTSPQRPSRQRNHSSPNSPQSSFLNSLRRARSPYSAVSILRVETLPQPTSCRLSSSNDRRGDSDETSDPKHPRPSLLDDSGEQKDEGLFIPLQAEESVAGILRLPDDEGNNHGELADAELSVYPSIQSRASQDRAELHHNIVRPTCSTDVEDSRSPINDSVREQSRDNAIPLPRKRRRLSTSTIATNNAERERRAHVRIAESRLRPAQKPTIQRGIGLGRHRGANNKEDRRPIIGSSTAEPWEDNDDIVQVPQRKRSRKALQPLQRAERPLSSIQALTTANPHYQGLRNHPGVQPAKMTLAYPTHHPGYNGRFTADFVAQFTWGPCAIHGMEQHGKENQIAVSSVKKTAKKHSPATERVVRSTKNKDTTADRKPTSTSRRAKYTTEDDAKIRLLRNQGLSWLEIAERFPGRTPKAIEVRYHTKLIATNTPQSRSRHLYNSAPTPPVVHDASDEEGEAHKNVVGRQALDEHGRRHTRTNIWEVDRLLGRLDAR